MTTAEELLAEMCNGYCPSCGCDLCNTKGCATCTWMRKARKFLGGDSYVEPPILEADNVNIHNKASAGLFTAVRGYIDALVYNRIHNNGKARLQLAEKVLRVALQENTQ